MIGQNRLLRDVTIVVGFWYLILFLLTPLDLIGVVPSIIYSLWVTLLGILGGVVTVLIYRQYRSGLVSSALRPSEVRGLECSIGPLPSGRPPPLGAENENWVGGIPGDLCDWYAQYSQLHPLYARLLRSGLNALGAHPEVPASPHPGGHGGATLMQHSYNVMREAIRLAPSFQYVGHRNKKGKVVVPPLDYQYRFDPSDPLIPIAALLHDVGKVECYQVRPNGSVKEVKRNHGLVGGRMLATFPLLWYLSKNDRDSLIMAVSHYHDVRGFPDWAPDRSRALAELIMAADLVAGEKEGDETLGAGYADLEPDGIEATVKINAVQVAEIVSESPAEMSDLLQSSRPKPPGKLPLEESLANFVGRQTSPSPPAVPIAPGLRPPPAGISGNYPDAYDWLLDVLHQPGRINGNKPRERIGWKYGEWVYLNDALMRNAIAITHNNPQLTMEETRGQLHTFTRDLMLELGERGDLMLRWNNKDFSPLRALFNTTSHDKGGAIVGEYKFTIIIRAASVPYLSKMPDCKYSPVINFPSWGDEAAINKKENAIAAANLVAESDIQSQSAIGEPHHSELDTHHDGGIPMGRILGKLRGEANNMTSALPWRHYTGEDGLPWAWCRRALLIEAHPELEAAALGEHDGAMWDRREDDEVLLLRLKRPKNRS